MIQTKHRCLIFIYTKKLRNNRLKKKVIFKTKSFPTGSETFVVNNVVEAIKSGFQVTIITDKKNNPSQSTQEHLLNEFEIPKKIQEYSEPKRKFKRYLKALKLVSNPFLFYYYIRYSKFKKKKSLSNLFRLAFYYPYRKTTFHVHFSTALEPVLELKKIGFLKAKIIVTFHGYDAFYLPSGKQLESLVSDYKIYVNWITVNSAYLKKQLVEKGFPQTKIITVPMGVDVEFFNPSESKKEIETPIQLITVARLVDLKGVDYGIQVLKKLLHLGYDVHYTIVGEGPEEERLKALCHALGVTDNLHFLGKKSQAEIKNILDKHHIFLMTSTIDKDGRREAFGVVSLEAQAMELPVIGFQSGGFPETLVDGKTGFLVEDQDVEAMAAVVEKLFNDRHLLQQMAKNARAHVVENFSFEKTTKKYLERY